MNMVAQMALARPFRDVFYFNCRYNPLLSALSHYTGSVLPFIANQLSYIDVNSGHVDVCIVQDMDEVDAIRNMGIEALQILEVDLGKVVDDTIRSGGMLYFPVDLYVLPGYGNYNISHLGHWLLVAGRGCGKDCVVVIEADDREEVNARQLQLSIQVLGDAYHSWTNYRKRVGLSRDSDADWKDVLSVISRVSVERLIRNDEATEMYLRLVEKWRAQMALGIEATEIETGRMFDGRGRIDRLDWGRLAKSAKVAFRSRQTEAYRLRTLFGACDEAAEAMEASGRILKAVVFSALHAAMVASGREEVASYCGGCFGEVARLERRCLEILTERL